MKKNIITIIAAVMLITITASAEEAAFDDNSVIVVMNTDAKRSISPYSNPFDELDIAESECIFEENYNAVSLFNTGNSTRILKLTLKEKGADKVLETIEKLKKLPQVKYAEPNYIFSTFEAPNDSYYLDGSQQALNLVGADNVWDLDIDCSQISVGIVDTGIQLDHEDLKNNIWINPGEMPNDGNDNDENGYTDDINGWDFADNDNDPTYSYWHGVHVAGIIGSETNNGIGTASLARNAKLAALKIFDRSGNAEISNAIEAFNYAKNNNITILNNSWGLSIFSEETEAELKSMEEVIKNTPEILYVCASGNTNTAPEPDNDKTPIYPASYSQNYENVISVANTNINDILSDNSHYGKNSVDIAAPGCDIMSTYTGNSYSSQSGTSMSAPMVTSAAAVMKAVNADITPSEIKNIIMSASDKIDTLTDKIVSGGRLNAYSAVSKVLQTMPTPTPTPTPTQTPTQTPAPTPTQTSAPTPTTTPTQTSAPIPTTTPTPTPTQTPAPTPTTMPTQTPTTTFKYNINILIENSTSKITISDSSHKEPSERIIIADYDKDGKLLAITVNDITSDAILHSLSDNRIHIVKAFIWNSLKEMSPLSQCAKKTL